MASRWGRLHGHPGIVLHLPPQRAIEHREPIFVRWLHKIYAPVLGRIINRPAPDIHCHCRRDGRWHRDYSVLGRVIFPSLKSRDFLSHCITKPGTSVAEERRIVTSDQQRSEAIPGVRNFGTTSAWPCWPTKFAVLTLAKTGQH